MTTIGETMTPPLTDYQADQLRRLGEQVEANHGRPLCVVHRIGVPESDVPPVWAELAELGLVKVTRSSDQITVKPTGVAA